jgi:hypothetical protein
MGDSLCMYLSTERDAAVRASGASLLAASGAAPASWGASPGLWSVYSAKAGLGAGLEGGGGGGGGMPTPAGIGAVGGDACGAAERDVAGPFGTPLTPTRFGGGGGTPRDQAAAACGSAGGGGGGGAGKGGGGGGGEEFFTPGRPQPSEDVDPSALTGGRRRGGRGDVRLQAQISEMSERLRGFASEWVARLDAAAGGGGSGGAADAGAAGGAPVAAACGWPLQPRLPEGEGEEDRHGLQAALAGMSPLEDPVAAAHRCAVAAGVVGEGVSPAPAAPPLPRSDGGYEECEEEVYEEEDCEVDCEEEEQEELEEEELEEDEDEEEEDATFLQSQEEGNAVEGEEARGQEAREEEAEGPADGRGGCFPPVPLSGGSRAGGHGGGPAAVAPAAVHRERPAWWRASLADEDAAAGESRGSCAGAWEGGSGHGQPPHSARSAQSTPRTWREARAAGCPQVGLVAGSGPLAAARAALAASRGAMQPPPRGAATAGTAGGTAGCSGGGGDGGMLSSRSFSGGGDAEVSAGAPALVGPLQASLVSPLRQGRAPWGGPPEQALRRSMDSPRSGR